MPLQVLSTVSHSLIPRSASALSVTARMHFSQRVTDGTSPVGTLLRFPFVIVGRHTGLAACDIRVGREIVVELDGSSPIQLDGEVIDGVSGYTVRK